MFPDMKLIHNYRRTLENLHNMQAGFADLVDLQHSRGTPIKRVGLDIHGVITATPDFLADQAKKVVDMGHEVHIMTGSRFGAQMEEQLKGYGFVKGVNYTHFFSITDFLIEIGVEVTFKDGLPYADALAWDSAKGVYAMMKGLNCVWDDSPRYGQYMPNKCWYFTYSRENFESQMDQVLHGTRPSIGRT
jgi:hypothetical protein